MGSKKIKTKTKSQNLNIMKKVNLLLRWSTSWSILPSFNITYLLFLIIFFSYGTFGKISYKGKEKFEDMKARKNCC